MTYVNMAEYEKNSSYFNAYTTSEILFPSNGSAAQSNCLTIDPTLTHISRATSSRIHSYQNQLSFEEGDYNLDVTYDWRMSSSVVVNYYADTGSNVNLSFIKNLIGEIQTGSSGGYGHNIDANGTYTPLSTLHSSQIALSSTVLRIEKRIHFRVEDNPVVLKWNFNWGSYFFYIRGFTYNLSVNKYPLGTLRA